MKYLGKGIAIVGVWGAIAAIFIKAPVDGDIQYFLIFFGTILSIVLCIEQK